MLELELQPVLEPVLEPELQPVPVLEPELVQDLHLFPFQAAAGRSEGPSTWQTCLQTYRCIRSASARTLRSATPRSQKAPWAITPFSSAKTLAGEKNSPHHRS